MQAGKLNCLRSGSVKILPIPIPISEKTPIPILKLPIPRIGRSLIQKYRKGRNVTDPDTKVNTAIVLSKHTVQIT